MARTPRKNMRDSSFFHIMVQGINKEYIFDTKDNKNKYCDLIYKNNEEINIIAYCIMNNHAHILIHTNDITYVENWMKKSNISYARYYNEKSNRVGYVFRDRYKVQIIKNQKHLYLCALYIHNNPVKAGMCKNMEEYEFSSFSTIYHASELELYSKIDEFTQNGVYLLKNTNEDKFELLEDKRINKDILCDDIINEFLKDKKVKLDELKIEKQLLVELLKVLKIENNISYRIMEKSLGISREKLRKLYEIFCKV